MPIRTKQGRKSQRILFCLVFIEMLGNENLDMQVCKEINYYFLEASKHVKKGT